MFGKVKDRVRRLGVRKIKSNKPIDIKKITYHSLHYPASQGIEFFLSAEYKNQLLGYCRLRFPHESLRTEITKDSALLRELHVVGQLTAIGSKGKQIQHIGIGKKLMQQAEKISRTHHKNKMVVISGIGVRDYYQQLGYMLEVCYMVKRL